MVLELEQEGKVMMEEEKVEKAVGVQVAMEMMLQEVVEEVMEMVLQELVEEVMEMVVREVMEMAMQEMVEIAVEEGR